MPVLSSLGDFRLEGELLKLKSSVPRFGSAWNKRWFRVEPRAFPNGEAVLVLAYYENQAATEYQVAKGTLLLRDVEHVNEVWRDGRLFISRTTVMSDRRVAAVNKCAQVCFEVDGATRHFLLAATDPDDMSRWVAGLQFICDKQQTLPWPQKFGRLPRAMLGTRSMARIDAKTEEDFEIPPTPKKKSLLPVDLDYGLPAEPPKAAKATPMDLQQRLEAAIRARNAAGGGKEEEELDDFIPPTYEDGLSESSEDDKPRGLAQRVFSRDLDAEDDDAGLDNDHRAGVSVRGKDGRMVGAHLSTVNLYAGSPSRVTPAERKQQREAAAAPAPAPVAEAEAPRGRRGDRRHRGKSPEPDNDGDEPGDGGDGGEDEEDVAAMRARMRARLKKNKKGKKKKKGKSRRHDLAIATGADGDATGDGGGKRDRGGGKEADGGDARQAPAAGVAMDEDFVEADWDEGDAEAEAAAAAAAAKANAEAEARRRAALRDPGVTADPDFAEADWDDEEEDATPQRQARPDPGVAADPDFAEADWDDDE